MTLPLIDTDEAADFLAEAANASGADLEALVRKALDSGSENAVTAAVLVAALCGFETDDADIEEVIKDGTLHVDEDLRTGALSVLDELPDAEGLCAVLR